MAEAEPAPPVSVASRPFVALLLVASVVGVAVSLAAWGFLELVHQINLWVFKDLPADAGYPHGAPVWWSLPALALAGLLVAVAVVRLPGNGGHIPAEGLKAGGTEPKALPGVLLAALATIGLGAVLGPEAPLLALGSGLGVLAVRLARRDAPPQMELVIAATGSFAALSMIFDSPLIAAVILIEAAELAGARLRLVVLPGLLGAGIGSLISIGMGSWTGLSTSAYALGPVNLPSFARPTFAEFGWVLVFAIAVAAVVWLIVLLARRILPFVKKQPFALLPAAGLVVAGLAIAFSQATGKGQGDVLFSGQDALPSLVNGASKWSLSALALLLVFKGLAWSVSLASFRGGPTFPAVYLGAAAGILASHLPGFSVTPGVAVGIGVGVVSVLRLPLSAIVLAVLLTGKSGPGSGPLVIVGVVAAYVATLALDRVWAAASSRPGARPAQPADATVPRPAAAAR